MLSDHALFFQVENFGSDLLDWDINVLLPHSPLTSADPAYSLRLELPNLVHELKGSIRFSSFTMI